MEQLKTALYAYKDVDNRLNELGKDVALLRGQRKELETTMASILARPELRSIDKLELKEDNSYVRIGRPETWTKPWSLSKKDLEASLVEYFRLNNAVSAEGCYKHICEAQRKPGKEFIFERVKRKNE